VCSNFFEISSVARSLCQIERLLCGIPQYWMLN